MFRSWSVPFLPALVLALALSSAGLAESAAAQSFPNRPIRIIVPQPPGGGYDLIGRMFADRLSPILGQPVFVENRPGAGTLIGTDAAAKAAPDGYTMLIGGASNMALNVGLYKKLPYDPVRDFTAVGMIVGWPYVLVARKDLPYPGLKELVSAARAHPEQITYASAGNGTGQHIATAVLEKQAAIHLTHVPYSGAAPAYQDLIGGRVDILFDTISTALPQIQGGAVRALAISSKQRDAILPDVPTVTEEGVPFDFSSWVGLYVPAGTSPAILSQLRMAVEKVRAMPEVKDLLHKTGGSAQSMSGPEAQEFTQREAERWAKLVRSAGISAD